MKRSSRTSEAVLPFFVYFEINYAVPFSAEPNGVDFNAATRLELLNMKAGLKKLKSSFGDIEHERAAADRLLATYEAKLGQLAASEERREREIAEEAARIRDLQRRNRVVDSRTEALRLRLQKKLELRKNEK